MAEDLSDTGAPALANAAGSIGEEAKQLLQPDRPIETNTNGQRVLAKTFPSGIGNGSSANTTLPGADAELQELMRDSPFLDLSSPMTPYEWLKCLLMVRLAHHQTTRGYGPLLPCKPGWVHVQLCYPHDTASTACLSLCCYCLIVKPKLRHGMVRNSDWMNSVCALKCILHGCQCLCLCACHWLLRAAASGLARAGMPRSRIPRLAGASL